MWLCCYCCSVAIPQGTTKHHCESYSCMMPVVSPSMLHQAKEEKLKLINCGIVQGHEHSCLTLVQSRDEARGSGVNQIKEEGGSGEEQKGSLVF